jgi:hypothetical protein
MMRHVGERLRASWATLLRGELEGVRDDLTTSFASSLEELRHDLAIERDVVDARAINNSTELANALHHVADALESIAATFDVERRDRRQQLDAVEFLLREMVIGFAQPTAVSPIVVGGSIDPAALPASPLGAVDIDLSDSPIPVDTPVEVRSRFHDRWVHGFAVAEYVVGAERSGYRLRRLSEADQLPLLFEQDDVRRATLACDLPLPTPADDPNHSMWR